MASHSAVLLALVALFVGSAQAFQSAFLGNAAARVSAPAVRASAVDASLSMMAVPAVDLKGKVRPGCWWWR